MNEVNEFTFCDDCGSSTHTWENCPLTRDMTYDHSEVGIFDGYGDYETDDIIDDWQSESWGD